MDCCRFSGKTIARPTSSRSGFTLAELLVTVAVASILLTIAASSFTKMTSGQRMRSAATDLYLALTKARNEALKLNTNVTLQAVNAGQWQDGWYISDPNTAITTKLLEHGAVKGLAISGSTVTFRPSGRVLGASAPAFAVTASGSDTQICVSADLSGRPYQKTTTAGSPC